jgi:hypothetical protein
MVLNTPLQAYVVDSASVFLPCRQPWQLLAWLVSVRLFHVGFCCHRTHFPTFAAAFAGVDAEIGLSSDSGLLTSKATIDEAGGTPFVETDVTGYTLPLSDAVLTG